MKTLALSGGDLVVGSTGHLTVSGRRKITQELSLALSESYGFDKYHQDLGSILRDFIGEPITDETQALVEAEVGRVLRGYIDTQRREVLEDHLSYRASRFDASDVVTAVTSISSSVSFDQITVRATLRTASGQTIDLARTVTA